MWAKSLFGGVHNAVPVKDHITPLFTIESTVALWLQHPAWLQKIMGLNPIWVHLELGLFFQGVSYFYHLITPNITHSGDYL